MRREYAKAELARGSTSPCSSVVEHSLGKGEVERSIRSMGTTNRRSQSAAEQVEGVASNGQGQIRADEAARERGDDWSRGSREDDADGGDDAGAVEEIRWGGEGVRPDRQRAGGEGAGDHDQHGARGVRDGEAALRARGLSGARGLHQEHDHRGGADGRGDPGGECGGRADAADAGAHSAGAAGGGALHRRVHEQGGHGRRQGAAGAGGDGGAGAALEVPVSGGQDADRDWQREDGVGRGHERDGGGVDLQAGGGAGQLHSAAAAG